MRILDVHAHVFPDAIASKAAKSISDFYGMPVRSDGSLKRLLEYEKEAGISESVIHSVAVTPKNVEGINRFIAQSVRDNPERLIGFAAIHPDCADVPKIVENAMKDGFKGIKIHPDMQRFQLDSPASMDMFAEIAGRLPVLVHTGDHRYDYSGPRRMKRVLDAFPDLICICAHFGGWSEWDEAVELLADCKNAYVDTSSSLYALAPEKARGMIKKYTPRRVLFGTDYPMWIPASELNAVSALGLKESELEMILGGNARELLGIA